MRNDLNKHIAIGHVGNAPVLTKPNNKPVCNFSMATTDQWVDKNTGEEREKTQWHDYVAFNGLAETIHQHVRSGQQLYIEAHLEYNTFEDKNGSTHKAAQLVVTEFQFVGKKGS